MNKIINNRKGQEESMGFVVIVMIILVIGVVFLGFSLKGNKANTQQQQELSDLTWSVLAFTTNCTISGESMNIWDLIRECEVNKGQMCEAGESVGENVCVFVNDTIKDILSRVVGVNATLGDKYVHAYDFMISTRSGKLGARQGNLSGNYFTYLTFIPPSTNVSAKFYYG